MRFAEALPPYLDALDALHIVATPKPRPIPEAQTETSKAEPLGDFRIVREIGRGGMGVVYEAMQLSLNRRVALKVLPFAAALNPKQLQRFKTEAHAAAQLHHTNIVPVYAVGCERGTHFYAMQMIDGRSLDEVIQAARGEPGRSADSTIAWHDKESANSFETVTTPSSSGRGRETFRVAARIAAQVADALEYAHEVGVLHRDIKPANLLLDARGIVWITDFGLAQVSAESGITQTGDIFGTLRYMSPEQAAGKRINVDHRTDVYSLGATLYELLTLQPVFPGSDRGRLLQQILHDEPTAPSRIDRTIPADLETIVLKALAKSPIERYSSAGELAADLRRFLDDRPILARRPTMIDQARKWIRRHPSVLVSSFVILLLGIIGLAVGTLLIVQEKDRTQAAYNREQQRADEAEQRLQIARRAADEMVLIAKEETYGQPQMEALRSRLLEAAASYYQEFIELRKDDPRAQADLALARDQVGRILDDLAALQSNRTLYLLDDRSVQEELRLTDEQQNQLAELSLHRGNRPREMGSQTIEEREQRNVDAARANETAVADILTATQLQRLKQIANQVEGPMAFKNQQVVTALQLNAEQRRRIGRMLDDHRGRPGSRMVRPAEPDNELNAILSELTAEQRTIWTKLIGAPFAGRGNMRSFDRFGPNPREPRRDR